MAAPSDTNFGSKGGHWQVYGSSAAFRFEVSKRACGRCCRNFKSAALVLGEEAGGLHDRVPARDIGPHGGGEFRRGLERRLVSDLGEAPRHVRGLGGVG